MDVRLDEDGNPTLWEDDVASAVLRSSFEDLRDVKLTQPKRTPKALDKLEQDVRDINERLQAVGIVVEGEGVAEAGVSGHYALLMGHGTTRKRKHKPLTVSPVVEEVELPSAQLKNLRLPESAQPWEVLQAVCRDKEQAFLTQKAREMLQQWLVREENVQLLTYLFWWFCADLFKPNERGAPELKATLLQRFAAQYVALSVPYGHQLHRPTRPSDQYMALFNTALAEATVRLFFNTFHESATAGTFDETFQRCIHHQMVEWTSGTLPYNAIRAQKPAPKEQRAPSEPASPNNRSPLLARSSSVGRSMGSPAVRVLQQQQQQPPEALAGVSETSVMDSTFQLTSVSQVGQQPSGSTKATAPRVEAAVGSRSRAPYGVSGERKELFNTSATSAFVGNLMAAHGLTPTQHAAVKLSRTIHPQPAAGPPPPEESYAAYAARATANDRGLQVYSRARAALEAQVREGRQRLHTELGEVAMYREVMTKEDNTRAFSNWLSGWAGRQAADDDGGSGGGGGGKGDDADADKGRDTGHTRAVAVIERRMGGGGMKKTRPDAKLARKTRRSSVS